MHNYFISFTADTGDVTKIGRVKMSIDDVMNFDNIPEIEQQIAWEHNHDSVVVTNFILMNVDNKVYSNN